MSSYTIPNIIAQHPRALGHAIQHTSAAPPTPVGFATGRPFVLTTFWSAADRALS